MRIVTLSLLLAVCVTASPLLEDSASGWEVWSPRDEISPRGWEDPLVGRTAPGSLALSGASKPGAFGEWRRVVGGVEPGSWYRLTAYYRSEGVDRASEREHVVARVSWSKADGKEAGRPEYAFLTEPAGEWTKVTLEVPAPPEAVSAQVELRLAYAPKATVW